MILGFVERALHIHVSMHYAQNTCAHMSMAHKYVHIIHVWVRMYTHIHACTHPHSRMCRCQETQHSSCTTPWDSPSILLSWWPRNRVLRLMSRYIEYLPNDVCALILHTNRPWSYSVDGLRTGSCCRCRGIACIYYSMCMSICIYSTHKQP
jgi:hypothetical protein